jgi:hypothetical protein
METVEIVKVYENKVWVESNLFGGKHVMVQRASPRAEPFCYCSFHYGYGYTDNASIHNAATRMAISLGATEPVEFRTRPFELPNAKITGQL